MLIKCPECGKEVSDKSTQCIHCGYPLNNNENLNQCEINGVKYDLTQELQMAIDGNGTVIIIRSLRMKCGLSLEDAKALADIMEKSKSIPDKYSCGQTVSSSNVPKCPTCGSTNLSKISNANKVAKIAAFGVFGMGDNGKTWKCNNCGVKW